MKVLLAILGLSVVAGCAAQLEARSDYDRSQDFSRYQTFAWMDPEPMVSTSGDATRVSPLNKRRITEAIEKELTAKGLKKVDDPSAADFVVSYTVGSRDRIDATSYPAPYRGPWSWYWGWPHYNREVDVRTYREGTLAIDIFDVSRHQPVWHGWATRPYTQKDVERAAELIPEAVAQILDDFPPGRSEGLRSSAAAHRPDDRAAGAR